MPSRVLNNVAKGRILRYGSFRGTERVLIDPISRTGLASIIATAGRARTSCAVEYVVDHP